MDPALLTVFAPACFAINMAPGPNNLLSVANAGRHGVRAAILAGAGRIVGFALLIALTGAGLGLVLQASATLFTVLKVVGALYLLYIAYRLWTADVSPALASHAAQANLGALLRREFWVAVSNPKAIATFTAFFPQFMDPAQPAAPQIAVLGAAFLGFEWVAIAAYAIAGRSLGRALATPRGTRALNRGCAVLIGGAGVALLAARRQ